MSTITKAPDVGRHRAATPTKAAKPPRAPKAPKRFEPPKVSLTKQPRRRRHPLLRLIALVLLVAVTIGAAVTAFLIHRSSAHTRTLQAVESAREGAVAAAAQGIPKILGYDYRQLPADIKGAKALATGQFLSDYTTTAQKVLASAPSVKAIVTATVGAQSIVQAQSDRVTLLLFVDQESVKQLKGEKTATTRIDPSRVQLTMSKVHGRWLVSDLEPL
jgi:Mce-associated membrane protein